MKNYIGILCAVYIVVGLSGCSPATSRYVNSAVTKQDKTDALWERFKDPEPVVPIVVAHRACWTDGAPENSLSSIQACIDMGVEMVEIDVALTADGIPVLFHDKSLTRMTGKEASIASLPVQTVTSLTLKERAGGSEARMTDETVPTLRSALELARGKVLINLDVKGPAFDPAFEVVKKVGVSDQILMKMRAEPQSDVLDQAKFLGQTAFMPVIGECDPSKPEKVCTPILSEIIEDFEAYDPVAYEIVFANVEYLAEGRDEIDSVGKPIWVNTLTPKLAADDKLSTPLAGGYTDQKALKSPSENWGAVINLGADIIQTDNPRELINYLSDHN